MYIVHGYFIKENGTSGQRFAFEPEDLSIDVIEETIKRVGINDFDYSEDWMNEGNFVYSVDYFNSAQDFYDI